MLPLRSCCCIAACVVLGIATSVAPAATPGRGAVSLVGGVPTLVVDGKPYGPMIYTRCAGSWQQLAEIADRRFPIHFEMVGSLDLPGRQAAVFKRLDEQVARFFQQVPNGKVILRLYLCNPHDFTREHPDELLRFEDGSAQHFTKWYAVSRWPEAERGYPSFASDVWRSAMAQSLREYVEHVRQSPYAGGVIGYFLCGGGTEEWYYWGDYDHAAHALDFSPPMLRALRAHLRQRYGNDVARLRAAWHDKVDFDTAMPPSPSQRRQVDAAFWEPNALNRMRDYYYVHNKVMEDSVLCFAKAVKEACHREQLVGMFHGYLQNHWYLEGGQATLDDVLDSPDIDFWAGPPQYDRRGPGEHGCIRFPAASLRQHGKLWISESDIRTVFSEYSAGNPSLHGRPPSLAESLACLQREYAYQLCEGANGWWFQMGPAWYHHPPVLDLFQQMQAVGEAAMGCDRRSATDIAAVVDLGSLFAGPPWPVSSSLIDAFKVQEICRIGAPVDHYLLRDILSPQTKRYKLYLMLNCFSLDAAQRRAVDERLRRDGATLVWMYAPGLFKPGEKIEKDLAHCRELMGFGFKTELGKGQPVGMRLTDAGAAQFASFDKQRLFGSFERPRWENDAKTGEARRTVPGETRLPQRFFADEATLKPEQIIARFAVDGQPSMVRREQPKATDIWISSVMAPADLLRAIARQAGCHLYCDADEIIYANRSFLAIHTAQAGPRTFALKRPADVVDVFSGKVLARQATSFRDEIEACATRLYYLGDARTWKAECDRAEAFQRQFDQTLRAQRKKP